MKPEPLQVFDVVEAYQIAHAVAALHDLDLFAALRKPSTADEVAAANALDAGLLRGMLEYVAARTDLLKRSGDRFVVTRNYSAASRFLLDLYIGAYGRNATHLVALLRNPTAARKTVGRVSQARAFAAVDGSGNGFLTELIRRLELNQLLDLGCGTGALLLTLAEQDPDFAGYGIDLSKPMCRVARARVRAAGLGKRIRVFEGDCRSVGSVLTARTIASVGAVTACNVANELFA
ncbi:MAG TPA: class I SAM-dependent methyltransferase, partial [Blastocatellia bacterium]|nr:class I SAM-dependent methyltransferase [Blastocatellia bacterium]